MEDVRPAPVGPAAERSQDTSPEQNDNDAWVRLEQVDLITFQDVHHALPTPKDVIPQQASTDTALSSRPAARRIRPERWTRLVLAGWATGLTALLALVSMIGSVGNSVMFVEGSSMTPLLHPGQLLMLNRGAYGTPDRPGPQRGDVVIFRRGAGDDEYLVKRVIGLPGDLVQVDTGRVFVNGTQLDEPYVLASDDYTYPLHGGPVRVPDGEYFVLGDNRPVSADSHLGWFVPAGDMLGQALPLPVAFPSLSMPASA